MGKKRFEFYDGQFLNRPGYHTDATIQSNITVGQGKSIHGEVRIRDCSDSVQLDLWVSSDDEVFDEETYQNNLAKLDIMIDSLKKVKAAYKKARKKL